MTALDCYSPINLTALQLVETPFRVFVMQKGFAGGGGS